MDEIWHDLPSEILERVLSFLPIPNLCQCRVVCKKWNELIYQPEFAALCAQAYPQRSYVFVMPDTVLDAAMGWELYDSVSEKYYYLSDDFLFKQVEVMDRFKTGFQRSTIAADKGLFCVLWSTMGLEEHALFICNPVTKQSKELSLYGFFDLGVGVHNPVVLMSVEDDVMSYKIYLIEEVYPSEPTRQRMHVYNSKAGMWQKLCDPPRNLNPSSGVIMNNTLYTLFWDSSRENHSLWAYDIPKNLWKNVVEILPYSKIPQLVVASGRLFFVRAWAASFSIVEIYLVQRRRLTIAHMPKEHFNDLSAISPYIDTWSPYHDMIGRNASFLAIGYDDSIVISSFRGRSVTYSLSQAIWHQSRVNQRLVQVFDPYDEDTGLYGNSVTLSLSMPPA